VDFDTWCARGRACARAGRFDDAAGAYRSALRAAPDSVKARIDLSVALRRLRKPAEAEAILAEALEISPASPAAHYELGVALFEQAKFAAAVEGSARRFGSPDFAQAI
jgi:cytochrome c-type biogenesis protein CcmH/NrfG